MSPCQEIWSIYNQPGLFLVFCIEGLVILTNAYKACEMEKCPKIDKNTTANGEKPWSPCEVTKSSPKNNKVLFYF